MTKKTFLAVLAIGIMCGCQSTPPKRLVTVRVDPAADRAGIASQATTYDIMSATDNLIKRMTAHPNFVRNYNKFKAEKGDVPLLVNKPIDNDTTDGYGRTLGRMADEKLQTILFDTGLFDLYDDTRSSDIFRRIQINSDDGLEVGDLISSLQQGESPDWILMGRIQQIAEADGVHSYQIVLSVHDLRTRKLVWKGTHPFAKTTALL